MQRVLWLVVPLIAVVWSGFGAEATIYFEDKSALPAGLADSDSARSFFNWGDRSQPQRQQLLSRGQRLAPANHSVPVNRRRFEYTVKPRDGDRQEQRRCLMCPSNSVVITSLRCNCARMRRPVVRPCLESQGPRFLNDIRTKLVSGPSPGSLVAEGTHQIVLWVYDQQVDSNTPLRVCRYTQTVVVKRCPTMALSPWHRMNCTAGNRMNSHCHFQCQAGRLLRGSDTTSCRKQPNGQQVQWSHPPPVCSAVCQAAPAVANGRFSCSVNTPADRNALAHSVCKYICDDGYVIPNSQRKYQHWTCSDNDGRWNQTQTPSCIKMELPTPIGQQCNDIEVTLDEADSVVELEAPRFQSVSPHTGVINVTCNINTIRASGKYERRCTAVDTELNTRSTCHYLIHAKRPKCRPLKAPINGDLQCSNKNGSVLVCQIECRTGHGLLVQSTDAAAVTSADRTAYCQMSDGVWVLGRHRMTEMRLECEPDPPETRFEAELHFVMRLLPSGPQCADRPGVHRVTEAVKSILIQRNSEVCRDADCSRMQSLCHSNDIGKPTSTLSMIWTVSAQYSPIEDYYYEGTDVPEGESLIEKLQIETESIIRVDTDFQRQVRELGGEIDRHSYRIGKLDLVCHLAGYVVNESTNKCKKCPVNTFQNKGVCSPCPGGTFQDQTGQTSCRPCDGDANHQLLSSFPTCSNTSRPAVLRSPMTRSNSVGIRLKPALATREGSSYKRNFYPKKKSNPLNFKSKKAVVLNAQLLGYLKLKDGSRFDTTKVKPNQSSHNQSTMFAKKDDPCQAGLCQAGARCVRHGTQAKCVCPIGFQGEHCEQAYCPALMCFHGGSCVVRSDKWLCLCPDGYTGKRCQHLRQQPTEEPTKSLTKRHPAPVGSLHPTMGFCADNPCRNGGRCIDNSHAGYFSCVCTGQFLGELCQYAPCPKRRARACPSGSRCVIGEGESVHHGQSQLCLCPPNLKHPQCVH